MKQFIFLVLVLLSPLAKSANLDRTSFQKEISAALSSGSCETVTSLIDRSASSEADFADYIKKIKAATQRICEYIDESKKLRQAIARIEDNAKVGRFYISFSETQRAFKSIYPSKYIENSAITYINARYNEDVDLYNNSIPKIAQLKNEYNERTKAEKKQQEARENSEILARVMAEDAAKRAKAEEESRQMEEASKKIEAQERAQEKKIRDKCGSDYRVLRIGMLISRAQECYGQIRLSGELNRADGVVKTYVGSGVLIHSMDGRILAWQKR